MHATDQEAQTTFPRTHLADLSARGCPSHRPAVNPFVSTHPPAAEKARASLKVIAVRIALAAEGVSKVSENAPEPLDFLGGRRGDRRASRDVFPEFVQRHVEVFGGRLIQSQQDVVFHLGDLTVMPPAVFCQPVTPVTRGSQLTHRVQVGRAVL